MRRRMMLEQKPPKPQGALYWYGDECVDLTGGWQLLDEYGALVKHADYMEFSFNYYTAQLTTANTVDITPYRALYVEAVISQGPTGNIDARFIPDSSRVCIGSFTTEYSIQSAQFIPDITKWAGDQYVRAIGQYAYTSTGTMLIKRIWLE